MSGVPERRDTTPGDFGVAGRSARQRAEELRAAAPFRTALASVLRIRTEERAWRVGAQGEEWVGKRLTKLPPEWRVLHDLPLRSQGANVDHLVIGPGGVFSLNTKNLTGKVWVAERALLHNGYKTDYLPKATREAARVSAMLSRTAGASVPVRAVLVVMCDELTIKKMPVDVSVVRRRGLAKWFASQPLRMTRQQVTYLADLAGRRETWNA